MRRSLTLLVLAVLLATALSGCLSVGPQSFTQDDLVYPSYSTVEREEPTLPGPETLVPRNARYAISWTMTDVYDGYGGVMVLSVENRGSSDLFIYKFGLRWLATGELHWRYADALIPPGHKQEVGLLHFDPPSAPPSAEPLDYEVVIWSAVANQSNQWYDRGEEAAGSHPVTLKAPAEERNYTIEANPIKYYDAINEKVDFEAVDLIVSEVRSAVPLNMSFNQALEAYEWVRANIEYEEEPRGEDHWQSAAETIELGTGDCEDQAILLASILGALGLSSRVNIIETHAFPTLFVTDLADDLEGVQDAVSSYYWTELPIHFLSDEMGYWMVLDTNGFPYAGGLPALSSPTNGGFTSWTFDSSDWLITIDVTGRTTGWNFLPF